VAVALVPSIKTKTETVDLFPFDQARQCQPHVLHEKKAVGMALSHGTAEPEAGCYGE